MFRTTLKDLSARKLRLLTTSIAVLLGVAFMAGTLVLTDTIGQTFDDLFADVNSGTDAYVRGEAAFEADELGGQRARLDESLADTIGGVDGVAVAAPEHPGLRPDRRQGRRAHGRPGDGRAHLRGQLAGRRRPQPLRPRRRAGPGGGRRGRHRPGQRQGRRLRGRRRRLRPHPGRRAGRHRRRHRHLRRHRQPRRRQLRPLHPRRRRDLPDRARARSTPSRSSPRTA